MHIKKRRGEAHLFMLIGYIFLLLNTGWYIYGNVIFYPNVTVCNPVLVPK